MIIPRPLDNDFAEWAFGADVWVPFLMWEKDVIDLLHAWNERHPMHSIAEDHSIEDSLKIMARLYKEEKEAQSPKKPKPKKKDKQ